MNNDRSTEWLTKAIEDLDRVPASADEHQAWLNLSIRGLGEAYGENEPEYSADLIKEVNPQYAGG